jgi:heme/copper-type cytochrome/quinol oxidase subunit 2
MQATLSACTPHHARHTMHATHSVSARHTLTIRLPHTQYPHATLSARVAHSVRSARRALQMDGTSSLLTILLVMAMVTWVLGWLVTLIFYMRRNQRQVGFGSEDPL